MLALALYISYNWPQHFCGCVGRVSMAWNGLQSCFVPASPTRSGGHNRVCYVSRFGVYSRASKLIVSETATNAQLRRIHYSARRRPLQDYRKLPVFVWCCSWSSFSRFLEDAGVCKLGVERIDSLRMRMRKGVTEPDCVTVVFVSEKAPLWMFYVYRCVSYFCLVDA